MAENPFGDPREPQSFTAAFTRGISPLFGPESAGQSAVIDPLQPVSMTAALTQQGLFSLGSLWQPGAYLSAVNASLAKILGDTGPRYNPKLKLPVGNPSDGADTSGIEKWKPLLLEAQAKTGVPWEVLGAIMAIESGGNPDAVSSQGAVGLMQIMPQYHQERANKYGGNLKDPRTNILTAADFLAELYKRYGSWEKAAAAYFGAIDSQGNITGAQDATGTSGYEYVKRFTGTLAKLRGVSNAQVSAGSPGATAPGRSGWFWNIFGGSRYPVTQEFHNYNPGMYSSGYHTGIDVGVPMNTRLYAPVAGTVVIAGNYGGYGNAVGIRLDDGRLLILGHLNQVTVQPGQRVNPGTLVGLSGNTGYSTGPHTHVELRDPAGNPIDPRQLLTM